MSSPVNDDGDRRAMHVPPWAKDERRYDDKRRTSRRDCRGGPAPEAGAAAQPAPPMGNFIGSQRRRGRIPIAATGGACESGRRATSTSRARGAMPGIRRQGSVARTRASKRRAAARLGNGLTVGRGGRPCRHCRGVCDGGLAAIDRQFRARDTKEAIAAGPWRRGGQAIRSSRPRHRR